MLLRLYFLENGKGLLLTVKMCFDIILITLGIVISSKSQEKEEFYKFRYRFILG